MPDTTCLRRPAAHPAATAGRSDVTNPDIILGHLEEVDTGGAPQHLPALPATVRRAASGVSLDGQACPEPHAARACPAPGPGAGTEVNPGGLTYRRKVAGSPFSGGAGRQGQTMSCLLCGLHRPRSQLRTRVLVGKRHVVCAPSCAALAAALSNAAHAAAPAGSAGAPGRLPMCPSATE